MIPGINFGGGGSGGFDFGDNASGDIRGGPVSIDARTTTGGGEPELLGRTIPVIVTVGILVLAAMALKKYKG